MKTTLSKIIASTLLATGLAVSLVAAPAQANGKSPQSNNNDKKTTTVSNPTSPVTTQTTTTTNTASNAICSTNNVLLGGVKATACQGPLQGNDTGAGAPLETLLDGGLFKDFVGTGVDWSLVGKSDGFAGNYGFSAQNNNSTGAWGFNKQLNTNTFVVSLKTSTAYSAYLFTNYDWSKGLAGVFNTIGVALDGSGDAGKGLSHASIFASNIKVVTPPPPAEVPEPATLVGLGLALGGMLSIRRKSH